MDKISFVILTWNSDRVIISCLESIKTINDQKYEIILVDNGSCDKTTNNIDTFISENHEISLKKIMLEKNYGTTVSRNLGIQQIADDSNYICILDSDTVINQEAVTELITVLSENEKNAFKDENHCLNIYNKKLDNYQFNVGECENYLLLDSSHLTSNIFTFYVPIIILLLFQTVSRWPLRLPHL